MRWIEILREATDKLGQVEVAKRIGYNRSVVSQVLNGKYPGDIDKVRERVEGALMGRTVDCPVLGDITIDVCIDHQSRKLSVTNPMRVQMYRACRDNCPHSALCKEKDHAA